MSINRIIVEIGNKPSFFGENMFVIVAKTPEEAKKIYDNREEYTDVLADEYLYSKEERESLLADIRNLPFKIDEIRIEDFEDVEIWKEQIKEVDTLVMNEFNIKELLELCQKGYLNPNGVYYTQYNNNENITYDELNGCLEYLDGIYSYVNQFDLSPLEISIFIYDLIREREYKYSSGDAVFKSNKEEIDKISERLRELDDGFELESFDEIDELYKKREALLGTNDERSLSRSLFKVYNSDSIVCAGYAKLYKAVLEMFNIEAEEISYECENDSVGHAANIIHIIDDKYGIDCVLEVDPTWGRSRIVKNKQIIEPKYNYRFFFHSVPQGIYVKRCDDLEPTRSTIIGGIDKQIDQTMRLYDLRCPDMIFFNSVRSLYASLKNMIEQYNLDELKKYSDKLKESMDKFDTKTAVKLISTLKEKKDIILYGKRIDLGTFRHALMSVKALENLINPEKYDFGETTIDKSLYGLELTGQQSEELLLVTIFNDTSRDIEEYKNYVKEKYKNIDLGDKKNPLLAKKVQG